MIGTRIQDCPIIASPTGNELVPISDGSGKAKVVKFKDISTTTSAIANANSAAQNAQNVATQGVAKIAEMQSAIDNAVKELNGIRGAIEEAYGAAERAEDANLNAQEAATNANDAARKANTAAESANIAYNRIGGVINQITGMSNSLDQLERDMSKAVTFDSGDILPVKVIERQIYHVFATGGTYIGLPGHTSYEDYIETPHKGEWQVYIDDVFEMEDQSHHSNFFIVTERGGYVKNCDNQGRPTGYYMNAHPTMGYELGTLGSNSIKSYYTEIEEAPQWKEI